MQTVRLALVFWVCSVFTQTGWTTPLYDNFGPADSYSTTATGVGPQTATTGGDNWVGTLFTAAASGVITSIDVAVASASLSSSAMTFQLYADDGANPPTTLLESYNVTTGAAYPSASIETASASGSVGLVAGTKYWLFATSSIQTYWMLANVSDSSVRYFGTNGVGSVLQGPIPDATAFRINSDAQATIPEPTTLGLMGLGLAGLGFARKKKQA